MSVILLISIMLTLAGCGSENAESKNNPASNNKTENTDSNNNSGAESNKLSLATDTDAELSNYLVRAKKEVDGLYGYIDVRTGQFVIEPQFTSADEEFCGDGWAYVKDKDEKNLLLTLQASRYLNMEV